MGIVIDVVPESETAKTALKRGGGETVFAKRAAKQLLVAARALNASFRTLGFPRSGRMREEAKHIRV